MVVIYLPPYLRAVQLQEGWGLQELPCPPFMFGEIKGNVLLLLNCISEENMEPLETNFKCKRRVWFFPALRWNKFNCFKTSVVALCLFSPTVTTVPMFPHWNHVLSSTVICKGAAFVVNTQRQQSILIFSGASYLHQEERGFFYVGIDDTISCVLCNLLISKSQLYLLNGKP